MKIETHRYLKKLPDFKSKRAESFTTIALTFLAFSFFGFFAISPTLATISNLSKQLEDAKFVEKQLEDKINNLSILQQQYDLLNPVIPVVFSSVPQAPKVAVLIAQIQQITKLSGVQLNMVQTLPVEIAKTENASKLEQEKLDNYSSYLININIQGSYKNISDFLRLLSNFDRIVTIDSISLSNNSADNTNLSLNIRGKTFFKK